MQIFLYSWRPKRAGDCALVVIGKCLQEIDLESDAVSAEELGEFGIDGFLRPMLRSVASGVSWDIAVPVEHCRDSVKTQYRMRLARPDLVALTKTLDVEEQVTPRTDASCAR